MIIVLTGPTGSGKTDTSWALVALTNNMVFLDCDWFASLQPFTWDKQSDVQMVYEALSDMINFYSSKGHNNFIITLTSQMAALCDKYGFYLRKKGNPTYAFRLRCDEETLKQRIMERNRLQKHDEHKNSLEQQRFFDTCFPDNEIFTCVDSMSDERSVARNILKIIENSKHEGENE